MWECQDLSLLLFEGLQKKIVNFTSNNQKVNNTQVWLRYRAYAHDEMEAILVLQNNKTRVCRIMLDK